MLQRLSELERALRHHLTKNRLANVWANKERCQKVLEGRSGRVIDDLRHFFGEVLGNPTVTDAEMQAKWSELMAELSRVLGLGTHLVAVREVCDKVEASGAPRYAADAQTTDYWHRGWPASGQLAQSLAPEASHHLPRFD